jgi:hypothetical protein
MRSALLRALVLGAACLVGCGSHGSGGGPSGTSVTGRALLTGEADHSGIAVLLVGRTEATAVTGADGAFAFSGVLQGSYAVVASARSTDEGSRVASVTVDTDPAIVPDLTFTPRGDLTGLVTTDGTSGGISVVVAGSSAFGVTANDGHYSVRGAPTGVHDVVASKPGFGSAIAKAVVVKYGVSSPVPDLALVRGAGSGSILGKALLAGEPDSSGIVLTLGGAASAGGVTDTQGKYTFGGLADGLYTLTAAAKSTMEGAQTVAVTLAGGAVATAPDVIFTAIGSLTGVATIGGASSGNAGIAVFALGTSSAAFTDDAGHYTLARVPVGSHVVQATKAGYATGSATPPDVKYASTENVPPIGLAIDPSVTGSLAGIAQMIGLTHHADTTVTLDRTTQGATTADDGSFLIKNVATGTYDVSLVNGFYEDHVPSLLVEPAGAFLFDGSLYALPQLDLSRGKRVLTAEMPASSFARSSRLLRSPDGKSVAFMALTAPYANWSLYLATSGGTVTPLGQALDFGFSADGATLLYRAGAPGAPGTSFPLYAQPVAGGPPVSFGNAFNEYPNDTDSRRNYQTTPDGKTLLWLSGTGPLYAAPITGGTPTQIAASVPGSFMTLSPDAKRVLVETGYYATAITLDGSTPPLSVSGVAQARWLPDSQRFVAAIPTSLYDVRIVPVNGTAQTTLGTNVLILGNDIFKLTNDGSTVTYMACTTSCSPGARQLYAAPTAGAPPVLLSTTSSGTYTLSPDSTRVALIEGATPYLDQGIGTLRVVPMGGGAGVTIGSAATGYSSPPVEFTPDSSGVVFYTFPGSLAIAPASGGTAIPLDSNTYSFHLTADGRKALLSTFGGTLRTVTLDGLSSTPIGSNVGGYWLSPDESHLLFWSASDSVGTGTLNVAPIDGSTQTVLFTSVADAVWLDASTIAASRANTPPPLRFHDGLYLCPAP